MLGYRAMMQKIRQQHDLKIPRHLVHTVLQELDEEVLHNRQPGAKKKKLLVVTGKLFGKGFLKTLLSPTPILIEGGMVDLTIALLVVLMAVKLADAADGLLVMLHKSEIVLYLSDVAFFLTNLIWMGLRLGS